MTILDLQGQALSGATGAARDAYEQGCHEFRCFIGDPVASAQRAISLAPAMPMARVLLAWLCLLSTETVAQPPARAGAAQPRRGVCSYTNAEPPPVDVRPRLRHAAAHRPTP